MKIYSLCIPLIMCFYNTSCQESTKFTPFELMFGCKATIPIDIDINKKEPKKVLEEFLNIFSNDIVLNYCEGDIQKEQAKRLELVKHNIQAAQKKQKKNYDLKLAATLFYKVGALVLLKDTKRKHRKGGKLDVKWLGSYNIFKVLPRSVYLIALPDGSKRRKVPGAHLKPYRRAKKVKKASSKTAVVQAAVSLLMEEHDSRNQTNSVSVSENPYISIHSHSMTLHWNNTHHSNTTPIPSQVHDVSMSNNLTLNVAMVESFHEVDSCCSSMIVQGGFFPHFPPNGINFSPICKDPHKALSHQLKKRHHVTKNYKMMLFNNHPLPKGKCQTQWMR